MVWAATIAPQPLTSFRQASARCERVFGPDNRVTLGARGALAAAYAAAGRPRKAAALHRTVLAGFEQTLGPDHPTTQQYRADRK